MKRPIREFLGAAQFLTRIPLPQRWLGELALAQTAPYFPLVGVFLGLAGAGVDVALRTHLPSTGAAAASVVFLILITGALHEDGLGDAADGFGGGTTTERVLGIMRDSRIGSYGAIAIALSIVLRTTFIAALPDREVFAYFVSAEALSRWSVLPLAYVLPSARHGEPTAGQGARLARAISGPTVVFGTLIAIVASVASLHADSWRPWTVCLLISAACGLYFWRRIRGVTGDCFGAVIQLSATAIYLCGAWR
ncbi:MAG: adenosylcobinamide-GDP ribazoletransferase [Steroidobacteraceae bacterium]